MGIENLTQRELVRISSVIFIYIYIYFFILLLRERDIYRNEPEKKNIKKKIK